MPMLRLIDEDFHSFKIGYFPSDISAVGEYHFFPPGDTGIWYEPNKDVAWGGYVGDKRCWMIKEREGRHELECEQLTFPDATMPMLVAGGSGWADYRASLVLWLLCRGNLAGLAFRYADSRHFYLFALVEGKRAVLYKKDEEELIELAGVDFPCDCDSEYALAAVAEGEDIRCLIDGKTVLSVTDASYPAGKVGVVASAPARFLRVRLDMRRDQYLAACRKQRGEDAREAEKTRDYPQARLWKRFDLKDFGCGRSVRFGDLTGDGRPDILFIQSMPLLNSGDEAMISCMTAMDLNGRVLWQIGEPDPKNGMLTADVAAQIYDIDGDGANEVIYCKDFKIIVADGQTGATKYWARTPKAVAHERYVIYQNITLERIIGDSIRICNLSGGARPTDLTIKDRYNNIWAYDGKLNLLWHRYANTGHFPMSFDFNGDGREEIIAGHSLLDADGNLIWQLPDMRCHVDEIVVGRFDPENEKYQIAMAAGEDGLLLVDQDGTILARQKIGHAQRVSVADYRPDIPGLEICATTFWRNTGIISMFDCRGNRLFSRETGANGNVICPVNWTGDGRELILYSASRVYGGLFDGYGDRAVALPDDGHPELCCDAVDVTCDGREELVCWDINRMFIYTQQDSPKRIGPLPEKYPQYNFSNYRGEYSFPKR